MQSEPLSARTQVWALPGSLAATSGIDLSFSSSGYLDVSVHRVPDVYLWIQYTTHEVCSCRFPHSEIHGSRDICSSPWLFAAYHVFHRLLVPRHPPCALISLTKCDESLQVYSVTPFGWFVSFLGFPNLSIRPRMSCISCVCITNFWYLKIIFSIRFSMYNIWLQ